MDYFMSSLMHWARHLAYEAQVLQEALNFVLPNGLQQRKASIPNGAQSQKPTNANTCFSHAGSRQAGALPGTGHEAKRGGETSGTGHQSVACSVVGLGFESYQRCLAVNWHPILHVPPLCADSIQISVSLLPAEQPPTEKQAKELTAGLPNTKWTGEEAPTAGNQQLPACNETAGRGGRERIKVLFTPTICKVRCTSGRCTNFCENGNITALYSHEPDSRPAVGPGFRIFLCPMLCQNGGVCIHKDRCLCPPTFTGKFCHIPTPPSTNDIEKLPSSPSVVPREEILMHSEYLVPLQSEQQPQSNTSSSMVKVRVQHPPEASVKIHRVLKVGYEPVMRQQSETVTRPSGLSGARSGLLLEERTGARPAQIQAQTVRGDSTYTESSGFKYCFREVRNGKCSSPLPGLRSQETCCRGVGKAWGINECILCPSHSDINECLQPGFCENGNCVNTRGSYTCVCNQGYLLDASHGICICKQAAPEKVISEDKGQCYRLLTSGMCSLPILRNITKQICCCSRVGKAWGKNCEKCPFFGSAAFKEICPAGPGYQYSSSAVKLNQILLEQFGAEGPPLSPQNRSQQLPVTVGNTQQGRPALLNVLPTQVLTGYALMFQMRHEYVMPIPWFVGQVAVLISLVGDTLASAIQATSSTPSKQGVKLYELESFSLLNHCPPFTADVDECRRTPTPCVNGQCQNTEGGYRCICPMGYLPGPQGSTCIDLNECLQTPKPCSFGQCKNTLGSYKCVCLTGFRENPQQNKCLDIDECQQTPRPCGNGRCENSLGSYRCVCPTGYTFQGDTCTDINECEDPLQCPGQECVNSQGSYRCISCRPGFGLLNGRCSDIDECQRTPSPCVNGRCENSPGSYRCACATGFQLHGNTCIDIDECKNTLQCPGQECVNSQGSFRCVACRPGFELKGKQCQGNQSLSPYKDWLILTSVTKNPVIMDAVRTARAVTSAYAQMDTSQREAPALANVDECKDPLQCRGQECVNTEGSFTCVPCRPGYTIQNGKCTDVDECQTPETCGPESRCVNTDGSYSCSCRPGYRAVGPGRQCRDINECFEGEYCFPHGECMNTLGSYICVCSEGYKSSGNGSSCTDVDECSRPELCLDGECVNTQGSFQCQCKAGFTTSPEKTACLDIDECAETGGTVCQPRRCENTIGSYHCVTTCEPGYSITPSGQCVGERPAKISSKRPITSSSIPAVTNCGLKWILKASCSLVGVDVTSAPSPTDINECASDNICGDHAICQNFLGTYECMCNQGYKAVGNGRGCVDENECETMAGVCGAARCQNADGSFVCECPGVDEEFDLRTRTCFSRPQSGHPDLLTSSASIPSSITIDHQPQTHIASVPLPASQPGERKECYYNTQQHSTCHILTRNSTHQECCCTIGEGWGLNCHYVPCPSPGSGITYSHLGMPVLPVLIPLLFRAIQGYQDYMNHRNLTHTHTHTG
ncbi:latent-transforming growth factor beta-binding protein 4-like [Scleropages formosus]|uniref:Latent-transforming growth factor beta-binding protein 4-like n=1 Tax=Scleropages formosus TaxID=113540 RepID=A0A0P7Z8Z6_SCLFO|nr:latent-transforming growth factor beta-binding protein 4-like [Scleropages formosus]